MSILQPYRLWLLLALLFPVLALGAAPEQLDINAPQVQAVVSIQERVTQEWMRQPEILGTAVGLDSNDLPALVVFVDRNAALAGKVQGRLPGSIDGINVVVDLTGRFHALRGTPSLGSHQGAQTPPIQLGTSGGWKDDIDSGFCCGGTLGALVAIGGVQYILSNYHVLELHGAQTGAPVGQPGLPDVNCIPSSARTVATLVARNALPGSNVDCAIAQILPGMVRTDGSILEVGTVSSNILSAALNQGVKKSGRTTGLTHSHVSGLNAIVNVGYESSCNGATAFTAHFTGQIIVANSNGSFEDCGDSGSLVLEDVTTNARAIGLSFAGDGECGGSGATHAIANPIGEVLAFLGATMVGSGGSPTPTPTPLPCGTAFQNFDGVTAPSLPAGWVATNPDPGNGVLWVTTTITPDTAPNAAFIPDQDGISDKVLDTPSITINSASAQLSFRNNFNTEFSSGIYWDGGVLEVSINGGAFTDLLTAGGSFVTGGYTGQIDGTANNPLSGRMAWSGDSGGYITTVANLGPNVNGQTIRLRFRMGTDEAVAAPGWHVDTVSVVAGPCASPTPSCDPPTFVVTNVNPSGPNSLAAAILASNTIPSVKTITFNLPGSGPWTITTATLFVDAPVVICGLSQPGYDGAFNRVYIEGAAGVSSVFYLRNHGGTHIKGLGIYNYDNNAVTIVAGADWNFVEDCYIGFKRAASGTILRNTIRAPFCAGIGIQGNYNKVVRSTISGVYNGINTGEAIEQLPTGLVTHDNLFERNRIGTDPDGQTTVGYGNTSTGIFLGAGVQSSWIGGYNVIAGHGGSGVEILHPTDFGNRIYYNYLGVKDGGAQIIDGPTNNQGILIGNIARNNGAWGNVISGNRLGGIVVASGDGNWIWNNTIGLNQAQTQAIGVQNSGIVLNIDTFRSPGVAPVRNSIQGNMVCNHPLNGIEMYNGQGNGVYFNWIGTNWPVQPFPNGYWGVYLQDSSYNTGFGNAWGSNGSGNVGQVGGCCNSIQ